MSEKDKKSKQTPEETAAAEQPVNEAPESTPEVRSRAGDVHRHKGADAADGGAGQDAGGRQ